MTTSVQERQLLTIPEVAAQLRVSAKTVRRLIDRGLPALQLGGPGASIRVDEDELMTWLYDGFPPRALPLSSGPHLREGSPGGLGLEATEPPARIEGEQ